MAAPENQPQQMYMEELEVEDCRCHKPLFVPEWSRVQTKGTPPSPRGGHSATLWSTSEGKGRLVVFGGSNREAAFFNDVHVLDENKTWSKLECKDSPTPPARSGHTAVCFRNKLYVFGGQQIELDRMTGDASNKFFNDFWILDLENGKWTNPGRGGGKKSNKKMGGVKAPKRNSHAAVVVQEGNIGSMYVIGGSNEQGPQKDIYSLNLESLVWSRVATKGETIPKACEMHTVLAQDTNIFMLGGRGTDGIYDSFYHLNLVTKEWSALGRSPARCGHTSFLVLPHSYMPSDNTSADATLAVEKLSLQDGVESKESTKAGNDSSEPSYTQDIMSGRLAFFGGTDGGVFNNEVMCYIHALPGTNGISRGRNKRQCSTCQGYYGWTRLPVAGMPDDGSEPPDNVVVPDSRFAHTMTAMQSVSSCSAVPTGAPFSYLLFGGLNAEADLNDTYELILTLNPSPGPNEHKPPTTIDPPKVQSETLSDSNLQAIV